MTAGKNSNDPFNLDRFLSAQGETFPIALAELRRGHKETHWMWFIFPQIAGLGHSSMAVFYSIHSRDEAKAYLQHHVLGPRLVQCCEALLQVNGKSTTEIMGFPDDLKLRSSMTLFALVSEPGSIFQRVLEKYFQGSADPKTLEIVPA